MNKARLRHVNQGLASIFSRTGPVRGAPAPVPSSGLEIVLLLFRLLGGRLAVGRVLARAVRPDVGPHGALAPRAAADAAYQVLEGGPHLLVLVGVDAGVHDGVEHGQQQQPALQLHHLAGPTVQAVQQENHQARGPADHEGACNTPDTVRPDSSDGLELSRTGPGLIKLLGCVRRGGHV